MSILDTIKTDLVQAWHVVETDAGVVLTDAEHVLEAAAATVWSDFKPILTAIEPTIYADLKAVVVGVLTAFGGGGDLAQIETEVLNVLSAGRTALLGHAQGLGSNLLQLIIAAVKAA